MSERRSSIQPRARTALPAVPPRGGLAAGLIALAIAAAVQPVYAEGQGPETYRLIPAGMADAVRGELEVELAETALRLEAARQGQSERAAQVANLQGQLSRLESAAQAGELARVRLEQSVAELKEQAARREAQLGSLLELTQSMERERAETRGRLLELEREAARRPLVAAAVEGSESARRTLESERESLRAEVSALRSRAEQAESRAARLAQERDEALGTNLELQSQKRDLGAKLESGLHRSAEQLQQLEALQSELVRAQEAVGTLDRQRAQERARAELAEAALAECAERLAPALGAAAEAEPPQPAAAGAGAAGGVPAQ